MNTTLENSFTLNLYNTDTTGTRDVSLFQLGVGGKIPSDVVVQEVGSANYSQILNAQTGASYLIKGLTIQINQAPDEASKAKQILRPFRFKKRDVNGNEYEIQKVQTIDPYQYQYAYSWVNLIDDGESYVLDGNTAFNYTLEPLTGVNVTFNYVEAKNEDYDTAEGEMLKQKEIENIKNLEANSEFANSKEVIVKDNDVKPNNKKKNWFLYLIGGISVYLLFNSILKPSQK